MENRAVDGPVPSSGQFPALYMVLVVGLVLTVVLTVVGGLILSFFDKKVPPELIALAGAAVGFLGGLLVPTPKG